MKKLIIFTLLLICSTNAKSQSIQIPDWKPQISAGYSVQMWGTLPSTAKITVSYGMFQVSYFNGFKTLYDGKSIISHSRLVETAFSKYRVFKEGYSMDNFTYGGSYFALFVNPLQFKCNGLEITGGVGYFFEKFPDIAGRNLHFQLSVRYMITDDIGISWSHVSSGFNIWKQLNPGVDAISVVVEL